MVVPSLWEPYGLRSSPFFQDELRPADGEHPISLFVGREAETQRIERRLVSDPHTRSIVQGEPGVGKTSFVNRIKADAAGLGIATWEHPVRITQETTLASFVADVLRILVRIRSAAGLTNDRGDFWPRTVRWLEGGELRGGSLTAFGVGGGVTRSFVAPQAPQDPLYEHLGQALHDSAEELGQPVLLHVNNLENLARDTVKSTALLLRDLRDYLLIPGAHWVFVGASGIEDQIFRVFDQVGGIFPAAETLDPLTPDEMARLLELRYQHLRIDGRELVQPIEPAVAARLYALYQGDLRNFLRLLGDAAERILGVRGVTPMNEDEVLRHASGDYQRRLQAGLSRGDFEHLGRLVASFGGGDPEFRVTEVAKILGISQPSASDLVDRLLERRLIRRTRTAGRSVYYRPTGAVLVALGSRPDALLEASRSRS